MDDDLIPLPGQPADPDDGAHWRSTGDGLGAFRASGHQQQEIVICPAHDSRSRAWVTDAVHSPGTWQLGAPAS